ncbi:MAG TPA: hypothetical protein VJP77_01955 [Planctomycetota bacterium]|nr:hypothetical protein [Planctomycetota bacterium]
MRLELLLAALACCAGAANAQVTPPGGPVVSPPGKIWIGDGTTSVGTYSGATEAPFATALSAYGGNLREIEVLPGTYTFADTVDVLQSGVRIYGSKGAVIEPDDRFTGVLFEVTGDGFTLEGLTLRETRDETEGLVRVAADEASIVGCMLDLVSAPTAPVAALDIAPPVGQLALDGILVRDNRFVFHPLKAAPPAVTPTEQIGLRAEHCRSIRVYANAFTPPDGAPPVQSHQTIVLSDCSYSSIAANVFGKVNAHEELVRLHSAEATAAAISGTFAEDVGGTTVLHVGGATGRYAVTGNVIGRALSSVSQIRVEGSAGTVIVGNQIHAHLVGNQPCEVAPPPQRAVLVTGASDAVVSDNAFGLARAPQIGFHSTAGVTCVGNRLESDTGTVFAAIDLGPSGPSPTSHMLVLGNLSQGNWCRILMGLPPSMGAAYNQNVNP